MRASRSLLPLAVLLLASTLPGPRAAGGAYAMEILVDGRPLHELPHAGRTYVQAERGREYAVRLSNRTGERVAVALTVDGLNSIDARRTSAREATKWILEPWESIVLEGWQTSGSTARRFFFTSEERSYGAWLGKTEDLGIVSAAFFRERVPERRIAEQRREDSRKQRSSAGRVEGGVQGGVLGGTPSAEAAPAAPAPERDAEDALAATGIGREVDHRVRRVVFDEEDAPAAVVHLRYEYRDALVKLGVLPRPRRDDPLARRERARGFEDAGYAPDPYRCR
jgi:hypothetical protein